MPARIKLCLALLSQMLQHASHQFDLLTPKDYPRPRAVDIRLDSFLVNQIKRQHPFGLSRSSNTCPTYCSPFSPNHQRSTSRLIIITFTAAHNTRHTQSTTPRQSGSKAPNLWKTDIAKNAMPHITIGITSSIPFSCRARHFSPADCPARRRIRFISNGNRFFSFFVNMDFLS